MSKQLRQVGLATFPCHIWRKPDGSYGKAPHVPKGLPWLMCAHMPYESPLLDWSKGGFGVPIPWSTVVFDVDEHHGASTDAIDAALGVKLPWAAALIQRTPSGGAHYAFRVEYAARVAQDFNGIRGLDIRGANKSFIASGPMYEQRNVIGVMRLAYPDALPALPECLQALLEDRPPQISRDRNPNPHAPLPAPEVLEALKHVSPHGNRQEWVRVGMSLKDIYADDEAGGVELFDRWSSGEFSDEGTPSNYVAEHIPGQWASFKTGKQGGVTGATLYYKAIQNGWRPPVTFDASAAFGENAASMDAYQETLDRIRREACDAALIPALVSTIEAGGFNPLQRTLLVSEIKRELKDAGLLDKNITSVVDQISKPATPPKPQGVYGKEDAKNVRLFIARNFPDGALIRVDEEFHAYDGAKWAKLDDTRIAELMTREMMRDDCQQSNITAAFSMLKNAVRNMQRSDLPAMPQHCVSLGNGTLDMMNWQLRPHAQNDYMTVAYGVDYNPAAQCNEWVKFLYDTFDGDTESITLLQQWFGYMLSSNYDHHKVLAMVGVQRSGKSTIARLLRDLMGTSNVCGGALSNLTDAPFLRMMSDKAGLIVADAEKRLAPHISDLVASRIKAITGNDEISYDRKFKSMVSHVFPTRITIVCNSMPALFDDSGALGARVMPLVFNNSVLGREDPRLYDRLHAELEGILLWAVAGYQSLQAAGRFIIPEASRQESEAIDESYSPLKRFAEDCLVRTSDSNDRISTKELYDIYRRWCLEESEHIISRRALTSALRDVMRTRGVSYGKQRVGGESVRGFSGVKLANVSFSQLTAIK